MSLAPSEVAEGDRPSGGDEAPPSNGDDKDERAIGLTLRVIFFFLALQLVALLLLSTRLYDHYHLGRDFSVYYQAWWLIAHGHLDPFSSMSGIPFAKNHFELIMWPLSALYWLNHSPIDLLWVQDVAVVGAEVVVIKWCADALRRDPRARSWMLPALVAAAFVLVLNPVVYSTAFEDFHPEAIAVLFALLVGRDLYNGHILRSLIWTVLLLSCGDVASVYLLAVGLSAFVCSRRTRWVGLGLVLAAIGWLELISVIGADAGSGLASRFAYLTNGLKPGQKATIPWVLQGMLEHPGRPWHVLRGRWSLILDVLRSGGVVGVLSPWAIVVVVFSLVPTALIPQTLFIRTGFQNLAVSLYVTVGSVLVIDWCLRQAASRWDLGRLWRWERVGRPLGATSVIATVVAAALVASSAVYGLPRLRNTYDARLTVSPSTAAMLGRAAKKIPPDAEVLASAIVMGRFANRTFLSQVWTDVAIYPVFKGDPVVFVLVYPPSNPDPTIDPEASPAGIAADIAGLREDPRVKVLAASSGGAVLEWRPPPGTGVVSLPPGIQELTG